MFIAALVTRVKTWQQPKCPLTDAWIKLMWCIHTMKDYSAMKKEGSHTICNNMDEPCGYYAK